MAADPEKPEPLTLRRWSQRKLEAARSAATPVPRAEVPAETAAPPVAASAASARSIAAASTPELPPVESLTIDSDFTPFLASNVDEGVRRAALKKLFSDPRFNVMDGLDVYIDDYTKFTPVPPDLVAQLAQARYILDPPKTRVTEQGHVEDIPPEVPAPREREQADGAAALPAPAGADAVAERAPDLGPPAQRTDRDA